MFNARPDNYNLRNFQELVTEKKRTVKSILEFISYRAPKLWSLLPKEIESLNSLDSFKKIIENWTCDKCPYRLCKSNIQNVDFEETCPSSENLQRASADVDK